MRERIRPSAPRLVALVRLPNPTRATTRSILRERRCARSRQMKLLSIHGDRDRMQEQNRDRPAACAQSRKPLRARTIATNCRCHGRRALVVEAAKAEQRDGKFYTRRMPIRRFAHAAGIAKKNCAGFAVDPKCRAARSHQAQSRGRRPVMQADVEKRSDDARRARFGARDGPRCERNGQRNAALRSPERRRVRVRGCIGKRSRKPRRLTVGSVGATRGIDRDARRRGFKRGEYDRRRMPFAFSRRRRLCREN